VRSVQFEDKRFRVTKSDFFLRTSDVNTCMYLHTTRFRIIIGTKYTCSFILHSSHLFFSTSFYCYLIFVSRDLPQDTAASLDRHVQSTLHGRQLSVTYTRLAPAQGTTY
jgi:hypothetical protein